MNSTSPVRLGHVGMKQGGGGHHGPGGSDEAVTVEQDGAQPGIARRREERDREPPGVSGRDREPRDGQLEASERWHGLAGAKPAGEIHLGGVRRNASGGGEAGVGAPLREVAAAPGRVDDKITDDVTVRGSDTPRSGRAVSRGEQ
jgi:hypothetical protein